MNKELKKVIINYIFDNEKQFNLTNATIEKFRPYIYDSTGNYLIGGADVSQFIEHSIKLFINS